jgi:hypothetical protein
MFVSLPARRKIASGIRVNQFQDDEASFLIMKGQSIDQGSAGVNA